MSLVVGAASESTMVIVADSKITISAPDRRTSSAHDHASGETVDRFNLREFDHALPKIVWLSPTIIVGYAGSDPEQQLELLSGLRGRALPDVLLALGSVNTADFVILCSDPEPAIWRVVQGATENCTQEGRAAIGSKDAIKAFEWAWAPWPASTDVDFRAMSSMDHVISFKRDESVGAFLMYAVLTADGFAFVPRGQTVLMAPSDTMQLQVGAGTDSTPGATAFYLEQAGFGVVYPHEHPWSPRKISAQTAKEFVSLAGATADPSDGAGTAAQSIVLADPPVRLPI